MSSEQNGSHFNEQAYFDSVVLPKIQELIELCADRAIPLLVGACFAIEPVGDEGENVGMCKAGCLPSHRITAQMALAACALQASEEQADAAHDVLHGEAFTTRHVEEFSDRVQEEVDKVVEKIMSRFN